MVGSIWDDSYRITPKHIANVLLSARCLLVSNSKSTSILFYLRFDFKFMLWMSPKLMAFFSIKFDGMKNELNWTEAIIAAMIHAHKHLPMTPSNLTNHSNVTHHLSKGIRQSNSSLTSMRSRYKIMMVCPEKSPNLVGKEWNHSQLRILLLFFAKMKWILNNWNTDDLKLACYGQTIIISNLDLHPNS